MTDARTKAQAAYDLANAEIQKLTNVRPVAELKALIDAAQRELAGLPTTRSVPQVQALIDGARVSTQHADCAAGSNRSICARLAQWKSELVRAGQRQRVEKEITDLAAEHARAEQRSKLKGELDAAAEKLERIGTPKLANSDAAAFATYLSGLGIPVEPDRLNKILVLLAVFMLEFGGGLALSVGMGFSAAPMSAAPPLKSEDAADVPQLAPAADVAAPVPPASAIPTVAEVTSVARFLDILQANGGQIQAGQRALSKAVGISKAQMHRLIKELVDAKRIAKSTGPKGTSIHLLP